MTLIPALGMIRVSSKKQEQHGYSIPEQKHAIQQFADTHNVRIVEYVSEVKTGFTADREDVKRMRVLAESGKIRAVVVFVMDRLSRGLEVQLALRNEIKLLNLQLYTTTRGLIEDTPEANLSSNVEGAFSQYQIDILIRGSKMGKLGKAKSGRWVGGGNPPYGAKRIGERSTVRLVVDSETMAIVKEIFDSYTGWNGVKRLGLRRICEIMMERGVLAPYGGTRWHPSTVSKILQSRAYIGIIEYRNIEIQVPELAVIPHEQWHAAQRQAEENVFEAARNRRREYLLARRINCACGLTVRATTRISRHQTEYANYYCSSRSAPRGLYPVCHYGFIKVQKVDEAVWRFIRESLQDDDLREGIIQSDRQPPPDVAETKRQLATIDADVQRLNRQIDKWLSAFGSDDDAELAAKVEGNIRDARRKIIELRQKREELATESDRRAETLLRRREIYERISKMQRKLDRATFAVKRTVIELLDVRIKMAYHEDGRKFGYLTCVLFDTPQVVDFE